IRLTVECRTVNLRYVGTGSVGIVIQDVLYLHGDAARQHFLLIPARQYECRQLFAREGWGKRIPNFYVIPVCGVGFGVDDYSPRAVEIFDLEPHPAVGIAPRAIGADDLAWRTELREYPSLRGAVSGNGSR